MATVTRPIMIELFRSLSPTTRALYESMLDLTKCNAGYLNQFKIKKIGSVQLVGTLPNLAKAMHYTPSMIKKHIGGLEDKGLIKRTITKRNRERESIITMCGVANWRTNW